MKNILKIILVLGFIVGCSRSNPEDFDPQHREYDYTPRDMLHSSSIYNGDIYVPYPIEELWGSYSSPYVVKKISNGKETFVNDNPSNLCNKGKPEECSSFSTGYNFSVLNTDNYKFTIEQDINVKDFSTYFKISGRDGSNSKAIHKFSGTDVDIPAPFEFVTDDEEVVYIYGDVLYKYSIKLDKSEAILSEYKLLGIKKINLDGNNLTFYVDRIEVDNKVHSNAIVSLVDDEVSVLKSDIVGNIVKVYKDKYFIQISDGDGTSTLFVNFYTNDNIAMTDNSNMVNGTILSVGNNVVFMNAEKYDQDPRNPIFTYFLKLYEIDEDNNIKFKDSIYFINSKAWHTLSYMENDMVLMGESFTTPIGAYMIPNYVKFKNGKFTEVVRVEYK